MNQNAKVKIITAALIAMSVGLGIFALSYTRGFSNVLEKAGNGRMKIQGGVRESSGDHPDEVRRIRNHSLAEEFKRDWRASGIDDGIITGEHRALAIKTVSSLSCSQELINLISYLSANGFSGAIGLIDHEMTGLFKSAASPEARAALLDLSSVPAKNGINYRQKWSFDAAMGCNAEQFNDFYSALGDAKSKHSAFLGRNLALASSDPGGALTATVQELLTQEHTNESSQILRLIIEALPPHTNLAEMEKLLPASKDGLDYIIDGRSALLRRWASEDSEAAGNYVMSHAERFQAASMSEIAESLALRSPSVGLEWVQKLPDGPYFDAAATGFIPHIADGYPSEARELAEMITNEALRAQSLLLIQRKANWRKEGANRR